MSSMCTRGGVHPPDVRPQFKKSIFPLGPLNEVICAKMHVRHERTRVIKTVPVAPLGPQDPADTTLTRPPMGPVAVANKPPPGEGVDCWVEVATGTSTDVGTAVDKTPLVWYSPKTIQHPPHRKHGTLAPPRQKGQVWKLTTGFGLQDLRTCVLR